MALADGDRGSCQEFLAVCACKNERGGPAKHVCACEYCPFLLSFEYHLMSEGSRSWLPGPKQLCLQLHPAAQVKERVDAWKAAYKQSASSLPDETPAQLAHRTRTTLAMESGAQAPNADAPQEASTSTPQAPSRSLADRIAAAK